MSMRFHFVSCVISTYVCDCCEHLTILYGTLILVLIEFLFDYETPSKDNQIKVIKIHVVDISIINHQRVIIINLNFK